MDLNPDISEDVFLVEEGDMRIIEEFDQPTSSNANVSNFAAEPPKSLRNLI